MRVFFVAAAWSRALTWEVEVRGFEQQSVPK
jgi:hypothetical protein